MLQTWRRCEALQLSDSFKIVGISVSGNYAQKWTAKLRKMLVDLFVWTYAL